MQRDFMTTPGGEYTTPGGMTTPGGPDEQLNYGGYVFNVVVLGESGVGKSQIIDSFLGHKFQSQIHESLTQCRKSVKEFLVRIPNINSEEQEEID